MSKILATPNPYSDVHFASTTVLSMHQFGTADPVVNRQVPALSAFSAKLRAYLRFQGIAHEVKFEGGTDNAPRGKVPFITVEGVKIADSDLIIGFLKTVFTDPDAGLNAQQRALGHLVQRTLEDHLYWVNLYYEFYDNAGSDFFFKAQFGGMIPQLQTLRNDMEDRTYAQGISRYTAEEVIEKAKKDLLAVAEILGDNRYLLGTDQPTSFDAVVFGLTVMPFQLRGMHPEITDFARSLPKLKNYMGNLLVKFFPEIEPAFEFI